MYIWPNGSVTGSVHVAELEAFRAALEAGDSLEPWAQFLPADAAEYRPENFPLPEPEIPESGPEPESAPPEQSAPESVKRGPGRPRKE